MENASLYNAERAKNIPSFVHFLDKGTLTEVFTKAGFKIEKIEYMDRKDYPAELRSDHHKESVGMIAIKE